jgi:hypothetical protein
MATAALLVAPSAASAAWTALPTPNAQGANVNILRAVDCTSADSCIAVGVADGRPLAERWDGTSWRILPTPDLPALGALNGVSCPWPSFCFAVGASGSEPLVEVWNGTRWSVQSTPAVPGGVLSAISCSGILACTAVGRVGTAALAMRWEGGGWQVQPTPNPAGSDRLNGVSCPLKRTCTAVGESEANGVTSPFVTRWFGRVNAWGLQSAPKPDGAEDASLAGVSCPVAPVCVAVGSSNTPLGSPTMLTERRIGHNWSLLPTPSPPPPAFSPLHAVSCPSLVLCRAVGPPPWRFDGTSWQLESIPAAPQQLPISFLGGISCPTRSVCMAVGTGGISQFAGTTSAKWTPP